MKNPARGSDRNGTYRGDGMVRGTGAPRVGFTLIEVTAALVIFAAGVLMAASLAGSLSVQVRRSGLRAGVVMSAQEKMEEMERLDYDSFTVGSTVESLRIQGRDYERTTVVTSYGTRIRSVEVTVEPADSSGPSHDLLSYTYDPW